MIKVSCGNCFKELKEPGALLFSPPDGEDRCDKYHLCVPCFEKIMSKLDMEWEPGMVKDNHAYNDKDVCYKCGVSKIAVRWFSQMRDINCGGSIKHPTFVRLQGDSSWLECQGK